MGILNIIGNNRSGGGLVDSTHPCPYRVNMELKDYFRDYFLITERHPIRRCISDRVQPPPKKTIRILILSNFDL